MTSKTSSCLCPQGNRCLRRGPRSFGTGILKDKSLEVFRDARAFADKYTDEEQEDGGIFLTRIAMKPTLVLTSNHAVKHFLEQSDAHDFYNGLKDFFFGLFGPSILFSDAGDAGQLRTLLLPLFDAAAIASYGSTLTATLSHWVGSLDESSFVPYDAFKRLSLSYNLAIFLGIHECSDPDSFDAIRDLTTTHWHGIISVPLNVRMAFLASTSYRKAQDAKEQLLGLIKQKLASNSVPFLNRMREHTSDEDLILNHMLVFVCALIPKACASILASAVNASELWLPKYADNGSEFLSDVLLECIRLWPPFVGGFRVCQSELSNVSSYHVPKGHAVFYVTSKAHRDPAVFPYPDKFLPERWTTFNRDDRDKIFGFGAGRHKCIGERFAWNFLIQTLQAFVVKFGWNTQGLDGSMRVKYLPVSRPAKLEVLRLTRKG